MEAKRGMVRASRHGVTATKEHGAVVRPSQLIASVRPLEAWEDVSESRASASGSGRGRAGGGECALGFRGAAMVRVAWGGTERQFGLTAVSKGSAVTVGSSAEEGREAQ